MQAELNSEVERDEPCLAKIKKFGSANQKTVLNGSHDCRTDGILLRNAAASPHAKQHEGRNFRMNKIVVG